MNTDSISAAGLCVVCGKDTTGGRGFMNLHVDGRELPICCPMCYKVYDEDPERYQGAAAKKGGGNLAKARHA